MLRRVHIHETEVGLRYRRGRYERMLEPGGHWLLGPGLSVTRVDARRRLMVVASQEVLTGDSVQLRLSAVVTFRVTDPPRALHEVESYEQELHVDVQLALRTVVAEATAEALLEQRLDHGGRLTGLVTERAAALGLERARGESAALRNLANAARLMEGNPALMNLRLLQTIEHDAAVPGTTRFVVNLPPAQ